MASFRILNQAPQYFLEDGSVNAGGKLYFFETDLTTPKNTWSDEAMTTLNSNPVTMDAAGRTLTDVWGDGEYGVVCKDANLVTIWTRNNVKASGDPGVEIPALQNGEFLTTDGSNLLWAPIREVPDPTGHADAILYSDGELSYWGAPPVVPDLPEDGIEVTSTTVRIGDVMYQTGTGTFPATGGQQSSVTVTFPEPFSAAPVSVLVQMGPSATMFVMTAVNSMNATSFNVSCDTNLVGGNIIATQGFTYLAIGPVTP